MHSNPPSKVTGFAQNEHIVGELVISLKKFHLRRVTRFFIPIDSVMTRCHTIVPTDMCSPLTPLLEVVTSDVCLPILMSVYPHGRSVTATSAHLLVMTLPSPH